MGVVVAVAVAVIVIVALAHVLGSHGTVYGTPMSYAQISPAAVAEQKGAPDGPWTPISYIGFGVATSASGSTTGEELGGGADCSTVWNGDASVVMPATRSTAPAGEVAGWFLFSLDAQNDVLITLVANVSGTVQATNLVIVTASCLVEVGALAPLTGTYVDTPTVVLTANSEGGSKFLAQNPGASTELGLLDGVWVVGYVACNPFTSSGGNVSEYTAYLNGTTGAYISSGVTEVSC